MKIGVLTSSRADFGIYLPLLQAIDKDDYFKLKIIVFGTHLETKYGLTINEISSYGFNSIHKIVTPTENNEPANVSSAIGETIVSFSKFWEHNTFDLVITLGDRYEMFAAVSAASPFNIKIAHIHAGETTLGAIDNAYRHSISLMSQYLFVSTEKYLQRTIEIVEDDVEVFNVGALSIDNLKHYKFYTKEGFKEQFNIDLNKPTILTTFHPETVNFEKNKTYIKELIAALQILKNNYQIVITMPNTDTMGNYIREQLEAFSNKYPEIKLIESFGMKGYLTCMQHCEFLLGNTSSGYVEAAYFPKWVINLGERQKGRIITDNIIQTKIKKEDILDSVKFINNNSIPSNVNVYGNGNTAKKIVSILKKINGFK